MFNILDFISLHYIELIAAAIAFLYLYLEFKVSIWLWPVGIILPVFYIYISIQDQYYGNILINIYYLFSSVWGLILWYKNKNKEEEHYEVSSLLSRELWISFAIFIPLFASLYWLTKYHTNSILPLADTTATTLSFIGMIWLAKKRKEHWFCWIIADIISSFIFYYSEDYISMFVFIIYSIVAIFGYIHWTKLEKTTSKQ